MNGISQSHIAVRAIVAVLQGAALFALYRAAHDDIWPATDGLFFAPIVATTLLVPLVAIVGLTTFSRRSLTIWIVVAVVMCAGLAYYDIFRDPLGGGGAARNLPDLATWFGLTVILFIVHSLFAAADADGRLIASYPRHYDTAWKLGLQLALALLFLGVFWGLLWLGAELFRLIKVEYFATMIQKEWFFIPATTIVLAAAIHVTDVRSEIIRGTRTLALTLLSWLLPVMLVIVIGFLAALPFTGLDVLWNTRRATSILLTAIAALVLLINCAYQDGGTEQRATILLYARLVAAVVLVPLLVLAAYGLWLRVDQYGWSPSRIGACACVIVGACYGIGYTLAAIRSRLALRELETTNVLAAFVIIATLVAVLTPIADPARISVADQVRRLEANLVSPERFDFAFLRFKSGRYGEQALERLKRTAGGPNAARISFKAGEALDWKYPGQAEQATRTSPSLRAENITVLHPPGAVLPDRFAATEWKTFPRKWLLPPCLLLPDRKCDAIVMDMDGDGTPEILLFAALGTTAGIDAAAAFHAAADGSWHYLGTILNATCRGVREALTSGKFEARPPSFKDIEANGLRLRVHADCSSTVP